jgi:NADPH-dependent stearoyl-CoA 9-desaturase
MTPARRRQQLPPAPPDPEALCAELTAIRERVRAELGERDARYIRRVVAWQRTAEVSGRGLLFVGALPPAWAAGVALLSLSKILENMEIGHNVLHGQYDWMRDPALASTRYEWDWACPASEWRHSHNFVHHTFTNVVGKDRDVGYGLLRMADEQPWHPAHLGQPLYAFVQMLSFEWAVAVHDLELDRVLDGDKTLGELWHQSRPMRAKALRQLCKEFVVFPLLAGPSAPFVFAGNLSANLVRNVWAFLVIFCGHFPDGVQMFPAESGAPESEGEWFLRQIRGSANIEGPRWFHLLSGHLSHQIEHHLFPDLPSCRYPEIAPEVRAICERYGVAYNSGSFARQLGGAVRRIFRCALPSRRRAHTPRAAGLARRQPRRSGEAATVQAVAC